MNIKSIGAHVVTALVTLALAGLLYGGRGAPADPGAGTGTGASPGPGGFSLRPEEIPDSAPVAPIPGPPSATEPAAPHPPSIPAETLDTAAADEEINVRVYESVNRSVVNITTRAAVRGLFRDVIQSGSGSGFVIDELGHILTNYHVIEDAALLQVGLYDGSMLDAEVVGADPNNDVALIRVEAPREKLFPLGLGDSSRLRVGQKVLAVGNPFGLERTLTTGIISSLDRTLEAKNGRIIKGIIQTDAAINPGNSGGPLLNSLGEVIGINTAIYSEVGQSAGIGFAVPIDSIRRILRDLIEEGRVVRADLGVTNVYSLDEGLMVLEVAEGGPADLAGIRAVQVQYIRYGGGVRARIDPESADVLLAIEGVRVRTVNELLTEVESRDPGETVTVTLLRRGRTVDVPVALGRSS